MQRRAPSERGSQMAKSTNKPWSAIIVIMTALLMCSLSSAAWTFQEPKPAPTSEAERKQALERLTRQLQDRRQNAGQAPEPVPAETPQPQPRPAPAAPSVPARVSTMSGGSGKVQLNFEDADLADVISQISSTLGLTPLIIDPEVKGTVRMNSGTISREDILPLFNFLLKNNNAALIKQGGVYQILPISSALKKGVDIIDLMEEIDGEESKEATDPPASGSSKQPASVSSMPTSITGSAVQAQLPAKGALAQTSPATRDGVRDSRLATHIVRVEFVPVKDLIEPIKLFMTDGGVIMPYERTNMLILTDYTDNAERILKIIRMLDNKYLDAELVDLVKIENNASADVADDLKKIFGTGAKESATGISFISLDRMNAIFVMAGSKRGLQEIRTWIKRLDASSGRNIQTYVYTVENSTASNIAMMLSALYGGEDASGGRSTAGEQEQGGAFGGRGTQGNQDSVFGRGSNLGRTSQSGLDSLMGQGYPGTQGFNAGMSGGYMAGSAFGAGRQLGPQLNTNRTVTSQILRGGSFTGLQDTVRLVVDDINNSIVIQATAADYEYISETIKKMDVLPRQAVIDARIFEVDLTDSLTFGVRALLEGRTDGSAGEHLTTAGVDAADAGALTASTFAFVGNSRQILMAISALRTKTKVRVLEAPSVLALDGMPAHIVVGSEVPYPGTSYFGQIGGATTSVGYRDTGISLIVLPRISASGAVTMELVQEVSAPGVSIDVGDGIRAPSFSKTSVSTTLSVKDGETVAIAGLIRDSDDFSRGGVPFLSDIPLLGNLFGVTDRSSRRSELIILITPHVLRTHEALQQKTQELKDSLRNVRKYADEKDREHIEDMEDARKDRYNQELKDMKKIKTPKKDKKDKKSEREPQPAEKPE